MVEYYTSDFELALMDFELAVANKLNVDGPIQKPFIPGDALAALRARLIEEESLEVEEALQTGEKSELAKELADLLYVVFGTAVRYGIPIHEVFMRVHSNNMLKIQNSHVDTVGKLIKAPNHPRVQLDDLF